jgi:hypothetical protein
VEHNKATKPPPTYTVVSASHQMWILAGSEAEQSLECGHGLLSAVMAKNELIQVGLQLVAAHPMVRADEPLLEVADGPVRQWHCGFRAFAKVAS